MTVGIAGLGLIGGSMARAIQRHTAHRVLGYDINQSTLDAALREGAIDGVLADDTLKECSVVLAALYPSAAVDYLIAHKDHIAPGALAVDLCGVKRAVCGPLFEALQNAPFTYMGGHPMAGREYSGFSASREDLFDRAPMILTPMPGTSGQVKRQAESFFLDVGFARVVFSTPEEHDRVIALTSQLAHVVSGAYVRSPAAAVHSGFSAGSFQDMTRVARLHEGMWTELMMDNREDLSEELGGLIERLSEYKRALDEGDSQTLHALLALGRQAKEALD